MQRILFKLAATVFLLSACKGKKEEEAPTGPPPAQVVDVVVVKTSRLNEVVEANGTVVAAEQTELRPEVAGRLVYLNVPEGKTVQQGTVLARINTADLEANLAKSRASLGLARTNLNRLKQLLAVEGINQADYDLVANEVISLQADIKYTQALIDKSVIRAPFTGQIGLRMVSPGAIVTTGTVLATLLKFDQGVKVDFTLPEAYTNLVKPGLKVMVVSNLGSKDTSAATVVAVEPQVNVNTRNLVARALLGNPAIQPGGFVRVLVSSGSGDALMVPTNAVIPEAKSKRLVVVKDGKAKMTDVETGVRKASLIQVTKGINVGDTVAVTGVLFARPNAALKVRKIIPMP